MNDGRNPNKKEEGIREKPNSNLEQAVTKINVLVNQNLLHLAVPNTMFTKLRE